MIACFDIIGKSTSVANNIVKSDLFSGHRIVVRIISVRTDIFFRRVTVGVDLQGEDLAVTSDNFAILPKPVVEECRACVHEIIELGQLLLICRMSRITCVMCIFLQDRRDLRGCIRSGEHIIADLD